MQPQQKVAFLGPLGTFSHQIAKEHFSSDLTQLIPKSSIKDVVESLGKDGVIWGLIPRENSIFGIVSETYGLLNSSDSFGSSLFLRDQTTLQVRQCLLGKSGTNLSEVRRILSHEQALGQSRAYLSEHFPGVPWVTTPSTAAAAELVARGDGTDLAVGCRVCADMYEKLEILAEGIQEEAENTTRFLLLGTSSLDRIPTELTSRQESRAFLRVLLRPQDAVSFVIMACQPEAEVMQVDRIPAPEMNPFTSVYFIEIQRKESDKHLYSEDTLKWRRCVEDVSRRIQNTGTQVTILGWL